MAVFYQRTSEYPQLGTMKILSIFRDLSDFEKNIPELDFNKNFLSFDDFIGL